MARVLYDSCASRGIFRDMAEKLKRLQAYIDQNTHRVLGEMGEKRIRGDTDSRVAAKILEGWVWDNHEKLERKGIVVYLAKEPPKDKPPTE